MNLNLNDIFALLESQKVGFSLDGENLLPLPSELMPKLSRLNTLKTREYSQSFLGATLANIARQEPWLKEFQVCIETSSEYDDQGSTYIAYHIAIEDVVLREGVGLPSSVDADSPDREDQASNYLEYTWFDDGVESTYFEAFADAGETSSISFKVNLDRITPILQQNSIEGEVAFALLKIEAKV